MEELYGAYATPEELAKLDAQPNPFNYSDRVSQTFRVVMKVGFGRKGVMFGSMRVLLSVLGWRGFYFFVFSSVFFVFSLMFLSYVFFR